VEPRRRGIEADFAAEYLFSVLGSGLMRRPHQSVIAKIRNLVLNAEDRLFVVNGLASLALCDDLLLRSSARV
jgi:hypothetical protein